MKLSSTSLLLFCVTCSPAPAASFSSSSSTTQLHLADGGTSPRRPGRRSSTDSRPRRPPPNRSRSRNTPPANTQTRRRAPHQFDHTKADARPFLLDPATYVKQQSPNEDAPCFVFAEDNKEIPDDSKEVPEGTHIISLSLDELFPDLEFSQKFCSNKEFRDGIRNAMREDIFDSTPTYARMSEKARKMLLLPDSSLQGEWKSKVDCVRMHKLTSVLKENLGQKAPTGDEFMETLGSLCGLQPSTHWIDIVGIMDRKISHSWHQDTGRGDSRTVLLGFPKEDNYDGVGVFSHFTKLKYERTAPEGHPENAPILYPDLCVSDEFIVKPRFAKGSEIIMFRDVDSIHSAPDVSYRTSVMRFM